MRPPFKPPTQLGTVGWESVNTEFTQRHAFIAICGETDTGKTSLALTARGPVAILHAAEKVKGILEPHVRSGKLIKQHNFAGVFPKDEKACADAATVVWQKAKALYDAAWGNCGTLVVDTEPGLYALRRYARFGTLTPRGDTRDLYTAINWDWAQMFNARPRAQQDQGTTLITIHTMSDEYKDVIKQTQGGPKKLSEKTGNLKMDGQKSIKYAADLILQTLRDPVSEQFKVKIIKPWFRGDVRGMELDDEMMRSMGYQENAATGSCLTIPAILAFITSTEEAEWV